MEEGKKSEVYEEKAKEMIEHFYNAGKGSIAAFRAMVPSVQPGARAIKEFKNAQKEMLLAARSFIDGQIAFIDSLEFDYSRSRGKRNIRKVDVREKKQA
jgi:hypothetical protein